jgi:hypothetical protein
MPLPDGRGSETLAEPRAWASGFEIPVLGKGSVAITVPS